MMPCLDYNSDRECIDENRLFPNKNVNEINAIEVLQYLTEGHGNEYRYAVNNNTMPIRKYLEPAFRFETDNSL
ncbi:hypothetical protein PMIT1318_02075 [Prochlorococcus marinus str. MIT 1318]|uniref:hypothetical protein n=1 Tax=Prochlorococcus TaxID=1218 RepID=UPI0007B3B398|nr:hypothetical protein [Prochlorococcus marinus]KZR70933.1 hypothetical protein PMIT1318_02075 [Prochlorococcus marinus str. MIT 1318]